VFMGIQGMVNRHPKRLKTSPKCYLCPRTSVTHVYGLYSEARKERPRGGARSKINVPKALKKTIAM
jgi:hypothetical protein